MKGKQKKSKVSGWADMGVDDVSKARENRERIKSGFALAWWRWMEAKRDSIVGNRFPDDIPTAGLPVSRRSKKQERG